MRSLAASGICTTAVLRYARWDLSQVDLVDPRSGIILCAVHPLNKSANADGQRRRLDRVGPDLSALPATAMAPLMRHLLCAQDDAGWAPAYLPTPMPSNPPPAPPSPPAEAAS